MVYVLIGYMWLFIHRPFEVWPALLEYRIELAYALLMGFVWLFYDKKQWLPNPLHAAFLSFTILVLVCWLASPWAAPSLVIENYLKVIVFYVILVTVVRDEAGLRLVIKAFVVIMALYMLHSLWEYHNGRHHFRMDIERLIGVDSTMNDPNTFGASVVYALPIALSLWETDGADTRRGKWTRLLLSAYIGISAVCIVLTGSRAAFLGLIVSGIFLARQARLSRRVKVAALFLSPLLWFAIPGDMQLRFATILFPELGPANAEVSAKGRLDGFYMGLNLWMANPVTGCGPGAWIPASGSPSESHCLYGQLPGEMGTLGVLSFAAILILFRSNRRWIMRAYKDHPEWGSDFLARLNQGIGLALLLMLFEGLFGHNLFRYNWLWYGAFLIIGKHVVAQRLLQAECIEAVPVNHIPGEHHAWTGMPV